MKRLFQCVGRRRSTGSRPADPAADNINTDSTVATSQVRDPLPDRDESGPMFAVSHTPPAAVDASGREEEAAESAGDTADCTPATVSAVDVTLDEAETARLSTPPLSYTIPLSSTFHFSISLV
ncbi:hypothetical protein LSAT2_010333, partial [Lamellibrachia satsuma]